MKRFLNIQSLILALFFAALVFSLWAASVGWFASLMQVHSFRQTQTALSAWFIALGGPILRYETPVLGAPWSIPFEFPLYQALAAWLQMITGWSIEVCGRTVGRGFFYLSLLPLYSLARSLGMEKRYALLPLLFFLMSPMYLYWSRAFLIESTALFFGLAYLAAGVAWIRGRGAVVLAGAVVFGVLGALVKTTTYLGFAGILCLWMLVEWNRDRKLGNKLIAGHALALLIPFLGALAWTKFADGVKSENPLAGFITSKALMLWNFGTPEQRISKDFWMMLFRQTLHDSIGHRSTWILSVALALWVGRRAWVYFLCTAFFLAVPLTFTNLHLVHNYYANANGVFMVFGLAWLVYVLLSHENRWKKYAGLFLLGFALFHSVREYMGKPYHMQMVETPAPKLLGEKIQSLVPEDKVIVIFGWDWDPTVAYFAKRRAIMPRSATSWDDENLQKSLANLRAEGRKLGAIVICGDRSKKNPLVNHPLVGALLADDICGVFGVVGE